VLLSVSVGPSKNFSGARHSTLVPRMTTEKRCFEMRSGKLTQFARSHCESALNPVDSRLRGCSCSGEVAGVGGQLEGVRARHRVNLRRWR